MVRMSTDCTRPITVEELVALAGGPSKLGSALGISRPAIHYWMKRKRVPAERVPAVAALTGVSRDRIRADLYSE